MLKIGLYSTKAAAASSIGTAAATYPKFLSPVTSFAKYPRSG